MGKYVTNESDIFSIFSKPSWKAENISTFPSNYTPVNTGEEFIRVSILASGVSVNRRSVAGVCIVEIYTPAGKSTRRANLIADTLDRHLENKSVETLLGTVTQLSNSTMTHQGIDIDNTTLFRSTYQITFNYFGAI